MRESARETSCLPIDKHIATCHKNIYFWCDAISEVIIIELLQVSLISLDGHRDWTGYPIDGDTIFVDTNGCLLLADKFTKLLIATIGWCCPPVSDRSFTKYLFVNIYGMYTCPHILRGCWCSLYDRQDMVDRDERHVVVLQWGGRLGKVDAERLQVTDSRRVVVALDAADGGEEQHGTRLKVGHVGIEVAGSGRCRRKRSGLIASAVGEVNLTVVHTVAASWRRPDVFPVDLETLNLMLIRYNVEPAVYDIINRMSHCALNNWLTHADTCTRLQIHSPIRFESKRTNTHKHPHLYTLDTDKQAITRV